MAAQNIFYHQEHELVQFCGGQKFKTILADPPWQFQNRTGKVAPEHKRLNRYPTMKLEEIKALPVAEVADENSHLYLWVPNALLIEGLSVMEAWGFQYKTNIVWEKFAMTVARMAVAWDFISGMSQSCSYLAYEAVICVH